MGYGVLAFLKKALHLSPQIRVLWREKVSASGYSFLRLLDCPRRAREERVRVPIFVACDPIRYTPPYHCAGLF